MTPGIRRSFIGAVAAFGLMGGTGACTGTGTEGTSGTGASGGSTTGPSAPIEILATKGVQFNAGFSGSYGPLALAASAGEGELFFSEAGDAGSTYVLQHVSPIGKLVGAGVKLATGTPTGPPKVAVSSDGKEIACCWEDWGRLDPLSPTAAPVTRCNSVPVTGEATDAAMDGGFGGLGSSPALAQGASTTALAYVQSTDAWVSETILYDESRIDATFIAPYLVAALQIAPAGAGFTLFVSDGGTLQLSPQGAHLENDGGLQPVPNGAGAGSFAVATSVIPATPAVTAVLMHQGSNVVTTLLGSTNTAAIVLSSPSEQPLDALAAVACNPGTFGFVYALDGGDVGVREVSTSGVLTGTGTVSPLFGANVTSVGLAVVDGGLLIALGSSDDLAVYAAPCP